MAVSMHGSGQGSGHGPRRKRVDAELNLVAYIDLLTCMIAFLLITAVWTQLARLEAANRSPGGSLEDPDSLARTRLVVAVNDEGFNVLVNQDRQIIPRRAADYDFAALGAALAKLKAAYPDRVDAQVASEDSITFEVIVGAMDTVLSAGFPSISLVDAAAL
jgi:biopolymer transport protein TolR